MCRYPVGVRSSRPINSQVLISAFDSGTDVLLARITPVHSRVPRFDSGYSALTVYCSMRPSGVDRTTACSFSLGKETA